MSSRPNETYHHVLQGLGPISSYCLTRELQLVVNIRVWIFNKGISWTYKKLLGECGLLLPIGLLHKLENLLPRASLITICKVFVLIMVISYMFKRKIRIFIEGLTLQLQRWYKRLGLLSQNLKKQKVQNVFLS